MRFIYLFFVKLKTVYYDFFNIKKVALLYIEQDAKILAVSRKNDTTKIGLIGGKVDKGETFKTAAIRECLEETGLTAHDLIPIYINTQNGFLCVVFKANCEGIINTYEKGIVSWVNYDLLKNSIFGEFNTSLENTLIKYKLK